MGVFGIESALPYLIDKKLFIGLSKIVSSVNCPPPSLPGYSPMLKSSNFEYNLRLYVSLRGMAQL